MQQEATATRGQQGPAGGCAGGGGVTESYVRASDLQESAEALKAMRAERDALSGRVEALQRQVCACVYSVHVCMYVCM